MRLYTGGALPSVWYVYVPNNIFIIKIYSSDPVCLPNPSLSPITSSHSWMPTTLFPKRNINLFSLISIYIITSKEKYFLLYNTKCMHIFPSRYFTPIPSHGLTPVWKDTTPNSNAGFYISGSGVLHSQRSGSEQLHRWDCVCVSLLCWKEVREPQPRFSLRKIPSKMYLKKKINKTNKKFHPDWRHQLQRLVIFWRRKTGSRRCQVSLILLGTSFDLPVFSIQCLRGEVRNLRK